MLETSGIPCLQLTRLLPAGLSSETAPEGQPSFSHLLHVPFDGFPQSCFRKYCGRTCYVGFNFCSAANQEETKTSQREKPIFAYSKKILCQLNATREGGVGITAERSCVHVRGYWGLLQCRARQDRAQGLHFTSSAPLLDLFTLEGAGSRRQFELHSAPSDALETAINHHFVSASGLRYRRVKDVRSNSVVSIGAETEHSCLVSIDLYFPAALSRQTTNSRQSGKTRPLIRKKEGSITSESAPVFSSDTRHDHYGAYFIRKWYSSVNCGLRSLRASDITLRYTVHVNPPSRANLPFLVYRYLVSKKTYIERTSLTYCPTSFTSSSIRR
ncbi:uncharacterized protein BT62DRAFT_1004611 [Guyanagaster necrorhizus]|uniref:Uncharacterized protein n=1 Tax=Guyanagaster necrorhizus TaxID=856835 RepID=A0A9P7VVW4_9AGAR|nr:uncharacterized protein BT62DRAFT_1004611 [Guyanagaster necrorhizus MCA 3950]KAG7447842.1 hypothetical protein BT62DRAFT_1004611 [Guyanagaster necrorhizus MCA 3950]